jgi:hypothetical protein
MLDRLLKLLRLRQQREQRAKTLLDTTLREVNDARDEHAGHRREQEAGRQHLTAMIRQFSALTNAGLVESQRVTQFQAERKFSERADLICETRILDAEYKLLEAKLRADEARAGFLKARRERERIELIYKRKLAEISTKADARAEEEAIELWQNPLARSGAAN